MDVIKDGDFFICLCPHCHEFLFFHSKEINCKIFRHAYYRDTFVQINPHSSKNVCDELVLQNKVYGCAKPFRLELKSDDKYITEICDYL